MKFTNVENLEEFIKVVRTCKGMVGVLAKNGNYIDMKEWLTTVNMLVWTFEPKIIIKEITIRCEYEEDLQKIKDCFEAHT